MLVLGRRDWNESELHKLLQLRSGKKLRVYSQEMLLAFFLKGDDPLKSDSDVLERVGKGHNALDYLSEIGFDWPTTEVYGGGGSELTPDWLKLGFLRGLGYSVGRSGGLEEERRQLLAQASRMRRLPAAFPSWYRDEWGRSSSSLRLQKLVQTIAALCRNAKRRLQHNMEMEMAIGEWDDDLDWLRVTYFEGRYQFEWPKTEVW